MKTAATQATLGGLMLACASSSAGAQVAGYIGRAVDVVVWEFPSVYGGPAADGARGVPFPPLDEILPMPMPAPGEGISDPSAPGSVLLRDLATGVTVRLPGAPASASGTGAVAGFRGLDGGDGKHGGFGRGFQPMTEVADTAAFPYRMSAKAVMRFVKSDGSDFWSACSAAMLDAEVALLAGHCLYKHDVGFKTYAAEVYIIPGWDGEGAIFPATGTLNPFGWARGTYLLVGDEWVNNSNLDYDMGAVVLTRAPGMLTGWLGRTWGGDCATIRSRTYYNVSYPNGDAGCPALDGLRMYHWQGGFDACPGNLLHLDTTPGCFTEAWPGMSGSNAYYEESGGLFAHAVDSHKAANGTYARFCKMWQGFNTALTLAIDQVARGSVLDIQPLGCNGSKTSVAPGETIDMAHLSTNPTNFNPVGKRTYTFTWYLSSNDAITDADTALTTRSVLIDFPAMAGATFVSNGVQIPANTPPGTYWLGVIYAPATDGVPENNDSSYWDAHEIVVSP